MSDYNLVVVVGKLARDPELKYDAAMGTPYCDLALDVLKAEATSAIRVNVYVEGHQAELVAQFQSKGSSILVSGKLEADAGSKGDLHVRADRVQFMDRKTAETDEVNK